MLKVTVETLRQQLSRLMTQTSRTDWIPVSWAGVSLNLSGEGRSEAGEMWELWSRTENPIRVQNTVISTISRATPGDWWTGSAWRVDQCRFAAERSRGRGVENRWSEQPDGRPRLDYSPKTNRKQRGRAGDTEGMMKIWFSITIRQCEPSPVFIYYPW